MFDPPPSEDTEVLKPKFTVIHTDALDSPSMATFFLSSTKHRFIER